MDKVDETSQDVNNLYNLTTSLATSLSYHQLILYIRLVLANLWDSLCYIKTVSTHTMDYIYAATTGTLFLHILSIMDLRRMLCHIEETLPSTLHFPVSSQNTWHFYHYLHTHVLITDKQFLLLINVPIQDRTQQLSIYKIFHFEYSPWKFYSSLQYQYSISWNHTRWNHGSGNLTTTVQNMSRSKWTVL